MNKIIQTDGYGANGSTAVYAFDIDLGSWSTLGTARPDPAGSAPSWGAPAGAFDGTYGYVVLKDRKLYRHDPNADTWSAALATLPGTDEMYSLVSDGVNVFIAGSPLGSTSVNLWRYHIGTGALDAISLTSVITTYHVSLSWDYDDTIYILCSSQGNITDETWELWKYTISTGTLSSVYTNQTYAYAPATSMFIRSHVYAGGYLYCMTTSTPFLRITLSDGTVTAMTPVPGSPNSLDGCALFRTESDKILGVFSGGAAGYFKQYTISSNAWATLTDVPSTLGDWAQGYYTIPLSDPIAHSDSGGNPLTSLPDFPEIRIGGYAEIQAYYFKNLVDTAVTRVTPSSDANTTYEVSDSASGPWTANHDFGAKTTGTVTTYYIRGSASGGIPETRTLRVRLTDS